MNYESMTLEELEALRLEKMEAVQAVKADLAAVSAAYEKKARAAELAYKLNGLSPEDLELLQGMMPVGIQSEEKVGTPGE
jgi:hypothetical protein